MPCQRSGGVDGDVDETLTGTLTGSLTAASAVLRRGVAALRTDQTGLVVSVLFVCLSLTPSLLPRTWLAQGMISGLTGSIGYAIGAILGSLWRLLSAPLAQWLRPLARWLGPLARWLRPLGRWMRHGPVRAMWRGVLFGTLAILLSVSLYYGSLWQRTLYALVGEPRPARLGYVRVLLVTVLLI